MTRSGYQSLHRTQDQAQAACYKLVINTQLQTGIALPSARAVIAKKQMIATYDLLNEKLCSLRIR